MGGARAAVGYVFAAMIVVLLARAAEAAVNPSRFDEIPGSDRYREVSEALRAISGRGRISDVRWAEDGSAVEYTVDGARRRYELATGTVSEIEHRRDDDGASKRVRFRPPPRGHQARVARSPDERWEAECVDDNVLLRPLGEEGEARSITTDGHRKHRYGRASWVYGEELDQTTAMWWSPDSRRLAFYEFDEREVPDYYLLEGLARLRTAPLIEGYPKAGDPNPVAGLLVYDLDSSQTTRIDVGPERDQYVYNVRWSPQGDLLIYNRINRHQNRLEVMAADPVTGVSRVLLTEEQPTWQEASPAMTFLADGTRFIWETERTGWKQLELRSLDGSLITTLTHGERPVEGVERLDEEAGVIYYTAWSEEHPLSLQLHRVRLDGTGDERLTHDDLHHGDFRISPDGRWMVWTSEAVDTPPRTTLHGADGTLVATLAEADVAPLTSLGVPTPELVSVPAADGASTLYGVLYKPTGFNPAEQYPLLVDVYGGPHVRTVSNRFIGGRPECELGMLVLQVDNRGTPGRGKAFESATYLKLGIVDLDDQVAAVRAITERPYVDAARVGITGASYGGYLSALAMLRYPEVFRAAVAISAVTDWRNYDTIYTERYMRLPEENPEGYDAGSCVKLADRLRGALLLMHGMEDDNVHPANAWQFVQELHRLDRPFEMMFFPTAGHGVHGRAAQSAKWCFLWRELVGEAAAVPVGASAGTDDAPF